VDNGVTFTRTHDWSLVKSIVTHPKIYGRVSDDFAAKPEDWQATDNEFIWYILAEDEGKLLGLFIFIPENQICWGVHTCLLPESYGPKAHEAGRGIIQWIWEHTGCLRITTVVPEYNRLALKFAQDSGLVTYGINPHSYMKNGKLCDLIQLGISKPEVSANHAQ